MPRRHPRPVTRQLSATLLGIALCGAACTGTTGGQVRTESTAAGTAPLSTTTVPSLDCAQQLPPAAQAGQLLMTMVTSPQMAAEVLASGRVGGFGLKGRQSANVGDEVAAAIADAPLAPFVASDEEGGTVQRLTAALGELSGAEALSAGTPADAATIIGGYAAGMADLGFNMVLAPVADVGEGSDLGSRSYGDDPETVAGFVEAIVGAHQEAGLVSVVKHWPGIGGGTTDPHVALDSLAPIEELRSADLTVFDRAIAAGAPAIMVAHATVPGLTEDDEPTSLSRAAITGELRGRQGFSGLVMTDSLGMGAIVNSTSQADAAEQAISAGADLALLSGTDVVEAAHLGLTDAIVSKRIPQDQIQASVRRVLDRKGITGQCVELAAAFSTLQQETAAQLEGTSEGTDSTDTPGDTTGGVVDSGINDSGTDDSGTDDPGAG